MFRTTDIIGLTSNNNGLFHYNDSALYIFRFFCSFPSHIDGTFMSCHNVFVSMLLAEPADASVYRDGVQVCNQGVDQARAIRLPARTSTCWCLPPENGSTWERRKTQAWQSKGALQWQISFWGLSHLHCSASKVDRSHRCIKSYNTTYSV